MGLMETLRGWFGMARDTATDAAEAAKPRVEKAVETAKETASDVAEKAKPHVEKAVETAKDVASDLGQKAGALINKGTEAASPPSEEETDTVGEASDVADTESE